VREIHKTHMQKLQAEFEEMYLEAYSAGRAPLIDPADPSTFDLPFHVKWFRENLELPE
jgi:transcription factor C subunit 3